MWMVRTQLLDSSLMPSKAHISWSQEPEAGIKSQHLAMEYRQPNSISTARSNIYLFPVKCFFFKGKRKYKEHDLYNLFFNHRLGQFMYNDSLPNVALCFLLEGKLEAMLSYKSHILQQGQKITLYGNNSDHIVQRCLNWDHVD